jgi:hypothetical protein
MFFEVFGNYMTVSIDWNAVGAVGQWAGAIATTTAVAVALYLSRKETRVRVKIRLAYGFFTGLVAKDRQDIVFIRAINDSQRPVTLQGMHFLLPDDKRIVLPDMQNQFPKRLEQLERIELIARVLELASVFAEAGFRSRTRVRVVFWDATETRHWCRWSFDPSKWSKKSS